MKKITILVPAYNEEESLPIFYEEIKKVMKQMKKILQRIGLLAAAVLVLLLRKLAQPVRRRR